MLILGLGSSGPARRAPRVDTRVVVSLRSAPVRAVPAGFLGLSIEYPALPAYAGTDPANLNPVFLRLVKNLSPGQSPVLRIGGKSADTSWLPAAGGSRPPWVRFTLTQPWLSLAHAVAGALNARLILGVNLEADSSALAAAEADALLAGVGRSHVRALELGNEPDLYATFPWYQAGSHAVSGRPAGWSYSAYAPDYAQIASSLPHFPLSAPAFATFSWGLSMGDFVATAPGLGLVALHRYPLQSCFVGPGSARYPTIGNLLAPAASTGLADTVSHYATVAHQHRLPLRLDELNTVSCGAVPAVSNTFAAALWAPDILFELVRDGVDGVNIHTFPGAGYDLFNMTRAGDRWRAAIAPEYYGLLLFARAAPPGSQLWPRPAARAARSRCGARSAPTTGCACC